MPRPSRVRVTGPLAAFAQGFAAELSRQGYRPNAAANQLQLLAHLSRWLAAKDSDATSLTNSVLDEFLAARRSQGYRMWLSPKALMPLVDYLRDAGFAIAASKVASTPAEVLLGRFRGYLIDTRGLAATTARGYVDMVRRFVATRVIDGDDLDWAGLKPGDVTEFVLSDSRGRSVGSTKLAVTALRSLLGYLHAEGVISQAIENVIPAVAGCRLAGLPRSLEPGEVERLLSACDRRSRTGRRNFAMLMLLVRLGLRAVEVRSLELGDIDWRAGELLVRGKGNRFERLPLPVEVGQALAAYLQRGRPLTAQGCTVFVRVRAPHRPLSRSAVTDVVSAAAARAGLGSVTAHRLRHTMATRMVRCGVSLSGVGQVLRHRRLITTAIYAKVDRERLRLLARPWPGGAS
jgi:site-specific recombinase XerD